MQLHLDYYVKQYTFELLNKTKVIQNFKSLNKMKTANKIGEVLFWVAVVIITIVCLSIQADTHNEIISGSVRLLQK